VVIPLGAAYRNLSGVQKPVKGISFYSRYVNRPLGRVFAAVAAATGLSPNGVTVSSAVVTAGAAVAIATLPPSLFSGILIALLIVLGFALDAADGQLARLTGRGSPAGEWLDHVVDTGKAVFLHTAVVIAAFRHFEIDLLWLLVPFGYQAVVVVMQAGGTLREVLGRIYAAAPQPVGPYRWSATGLLVADSGVFGLAFLTWPWPQLFVVVYTALFAGNVLIGGLLLTKWMKELTLAAAKAKL